MYLAYPIQAILIYLSLLFAPADTGRINLRGVDFSGILIRDASGWNLVGPEGNIHVSIDGTRLVSKAGSKPEVIDLKAHVSTTAGHDWDKQPKLPLPDATILEKSPDGFKLHNDCGSEGIYNHTITYVRNGKPDGPTCNVLGAVNQPGIVALRGGDTLRSVLLKAGGPVGKTTPPMVWLLSGKPGEKLSRREGFALAGLLDGHTFNPQVRDRDTIYVEPTVFIALARDGSLALDGQPCLAADFAARLRDRVETGVRSVSFHTHRETPHKQIDQLRDACVAAGIPSDRLKIGSAAVPE